MEVVDATNVLSVLLIPYFKSIGLQIWAESYFSSLTFEAALAIRLSAVCCIGKNKPSTSKSKQSHIHMTGASREFFYPGVDFSAITASTPDIKRIVLVSGANITNLLTPAAASFMNADVRNSFTFTKIAGRASQETQVQVSKTRMDGPDFIDLRKGLHEHDLLVFLKFRGKDEFFAIGIPQSFYAGKYEISASLLRHLSGNGHKTIRKVLSEISEADGVDELINEDNDIADSIYTALVDEADVSEDNTPLSFEPEDYVASSEEHTVKSNRPATNAKLGKKVIRHNGFRCALSTASDAHDTFTKKDGTKYMEVHHLIPLEFQSGIAKKLDTAANIVPLCPLCHRRIHHGNDTDKEQMLKTLYDQRKNQLSSVGLNISFDTLKSYYNI